MNILPMHPGRLLWVALAVVLTWSPVAAKELSAKEVMEKNFFATKVPALSGDVSITLINNRGQERARKITLVSKLKGNGIDSKVAMCFTAPADVKRTAFLQIQNYAGDDDLWIYIPALRKTRRLVSSEKSDSFFGTDFAYGDMLLPPVERYVHVLLRSETINGKDCFVIESTPVDTRTRDELGYSRKINWIDKSNFLEHKVEYFDLNGELVKTQVMIDARLVDPANNRWVPIHREMQNHQTGHRTVYKFDHIDPAPRLSDSAFLTRALERE